MEQYDPRVEGFIEYAPDYAQPILKHLRALIHETSPLIMETIKWSCPFFDYKGTVCYMNAFKAHVGFGFWDSGAFCSIPEIISSVGKQKAPQATLVRSLH